jgi:hypothetical protein
MIRLNPKRRREIVTLILVFVLVLLASAFTVYLLTSRTTERSANIQPSPQTEMQPPPGVRPSLQPRAESEGFLGQIFAAPKNGANVQGESWGEILGKITIRLLLAALLGSALAFRPRRPVLALKPNPYVAQTQILLAVVASALMIIVGDNAARAFGIFAAVSLVRFRTNIRDPKEITVLLISLALGLATGVGRWDLAVVLTLFALALLWVLEYREPETVFRSLDLKVTTRDVAATQGILHDVFKRHGFDSELRGLNRQNGNGSVGHIVYSVDVNPVVTTDELSKEILERDGRNVDSIEWEQKKSYSYLYQ